MNFSFPLSFYSHISLNTFYICIIQNTPFCIHDSWTTSHLQLSTLSNYDTLTPALSDVMCKTTAQADIVLLVDGSWSIGRLNFKTIRAFIARMVGVFDIGPERVQIGGSTSILVITNNTKIVFVSLSNRYGVYRSCSVQRRPQDWMVLGCS